MINIDDLRPDFLKLIANNFVGRFNIRIPTEAYSKFIKSNLFAEVSLIEIYSRSIRFSIKFDKYKTEFIFYTSVNKSLVKMIDEFYKKVNKIVIDTFNENGEQERLKSYQYDIFKESKIFKIEGKVVNPDNKNSDRLIIP